MFSDNMMLGGGRQAAFSIANSVRLDGMADYFSRTPSAAGNRKKWTFSCWVKIAQTPSDYTAILLASDEDTSTTGIIFGGPTFGSPLGSIGFYSGASNVLQYTSALFRDQTAFGHLCVVVNTTQPTNTNRVKIYCNGTQQALSTLNTSGDSGWPTLNSELDINRPWVHGLMARGNGSGKTGCYIANPVFVDDAALEPSYFGEVDPVTGSWRPKKVNISDYGTNGFHLNFADPANLGQDVSGNANHWTPVSLGSADVVTDSPTNNYATLNPLAHASGNLTLGNLRNIHPANVNYNELATLGVSSGKWYWEQKVFSSQPSSFLAGVITGDVDLFRYNWSIGVWPTGYECDGSGKYFNNNILTGTWGGTLSNGDVMGVALDMDAGKVYFSRNGSWLSNGNPVSQANPAFSGLAGQTLFPAVAIYGCTDYSSYWDVNFGQRPFAYTPPTGFKTLSTANLPTPSIKDPGKHMDVVLYTGNGTTRSITGLDFQPDFVWIKDRSQAYNHGLYDSVRGPTKTLISSSAIAERNDTTELTSFNSNGFSLGTGASEITVTNRNGNGYVAWCWKAGGTAVTNTDGSITSLVSANPTAGFSIVTFPGGNGTVGHGLGVAPALIIVKPRNQVNEWFVWHKAIPATQYLMLSQTNALGTSSLPWNNTPPTSSVISVGSGFTVNQVAYVWAEIPGFSKFGSYTGNGSADGPFVHCGFRPRWIMVKRTDSSGEWYMLDTTRDSGNPLDNRLSANSSAEEFPDDGVNSMAIDAVASGFKVKTNGWGNMSGGTYIFAAFAEAPFGGAKTVPAKAR